MERNEATAKHVAWPSCAWLLLRFFPFTVGPSAAAPGTLCTRAGKNSYRKWLGALAIEDRSKWPAWMDLILIAHGRWRDALQSLHVGVS